VAAGGIYLPGEQFLEDGLFPCLPFLIMEEMIIKKDDVGEVPRKSWRKSK